MSTLPSQIAADPTAAARAPALAPAAFRTRHLALIDLAPVAVVIGATVQLQ
jgi:hypothetical protein